MIREIEVDFIFGINFVEQIFLITDILICIV